LICITGSYQITQRTTRENCKKIQTDKMLSSAGKHNLGEELKAGHFKNVNELSGRFKKDFEGRQQRIKDILIGNKKTVDIEHIKSRNAKGESLTIEEQNKLIIHGLAENTQQTAKSSFQNTISQAPLEQLRKTAQSLNESKDTVRLGWLKETADHRGERALVSSIGGQIDGIRTETYTDEQKNYQKLGERIEKGSQLFTYSIEKSKTGEFLDVRQEEILDGD